MYGSYPCLLLLLGFPTPSWFGTNDRRLKCVGCPHSLLAIQRKKIYVLTCIFATTGFEIDNQQMMSC